MFELRVETNFQCIYAYDYVSVNRVLVLSVLARGWCVLCAIGSKPALLKRCRVFSGIPKFESDENFENVQPN